MNLPAEQKFSEASRKEYLESLGHTILEDGDLSPEEKESLKILVHYELILTDYQNLKNLCEELPKEVFEKPEKSIYYENILSDYKKCLKKFLSLRSADSELYSEARAKFESEFKVHGTLHLIEIRLTENNKQENGEFKYSSKPNEFKNFTRDVLIFVLHKLFKAAADERSNREKNIKKPKKVNEDSYLLHIEQILKTDNYLPRKDARNRGEKIDYGRHDINEAVKRIDKLYGDKNKPKIKELIDGLIDAKLWGFA
jgi:hypothetical protein